MAKSPPHLGIDLGGTNVQCALVADGKIVARESTKTKAEQGAAAVLKRIVKVCDKVLEAASVKRGDVAGVGIGAPGAIDIDRGVVLKAMNLGWDDYPLGKALSKALELPVVVDNDVNVGAWGEYKAGAGRGQRDMFAIFVGTGIGGGLILDDRLYHGAFMSAGEIGHILIRADGGLGRRSVEDLASRSNMVHLLVNLIEHGHASIIPSLVDGDLSKVRSKVLAAALDADDPLTLEVVRQAAGHVGVAIANVVTLLSISCVVVGGGVSEALGKRWMGWVRESFERHVFPEELKACKIAPSALNDDAGPIGAALLAARRLGG